MAIRELARAKVNLTLTVRGRRPDGYHEIESLVTFAEVADQVVLEPGPELTVSSTGPFATEIAGTNLAEEALQLLDGLGEGLRLGSVALVKNLPVAAGLGGGSADAAAVLRAARRANAERASSVAWEDIALRLGADVPVCLAGKPALMRGIGEQIEPLPPGLPELPAVLVNPRVTLSTADIFRALQAEPIVPGRGRDPAPAIRNAEQATQIMRERGNDLRAPAVRLLPTIAEIETALLAQPGCRVAALSGSGPTCFGIFTDDAAATGAARTLAVAHPGWWIVATRLAGS